MSLAIATVGEDDLDDLRPLLRAYCDFYDVAPTDAALAGLSRALIADPDREGLQLVARDRDRAVGFATIFWTWSTTRGSRIGVMNDLYVAPEDRGSGAADALIEACAEHCRGARRARPAVADGARQPPRAGGLRPRRRAQLDVAGVRARGALTRPGGQAPRRAGRRYTITP